jgi:excisionase family DNA binding protein
MTGSAPTPSEAAGDTKRVTMSVTKAGKRLGLGKNAAYEAAHRGEIPVIRIGRRLLVPIAAFEAMLAVKSKQEIVAAELVRRLQQEAADAPKQ